MGGSTRKKSGNAGSRPRGRSRSEKKNNHSVKESANKVSSDSHRPILRFVPEFVPVVVFPSKSPSGWTSEQGGGGGGKRVAGGSEDGGKGVAGGDGVDGADGADGGDRGEKGGVGGGEAVCEEGCDTTDAFICKPIPCPVEISQNSEVCGSDGRTYASLCDLKYASCMKRGLKLEVVKSGNC